MNPSLKRSCPRLCPIPPCEGRQASLKSEANISFSEGATLELACRRTYAEDDIEVFSTEPGLDWISAHNFVTRLQKLSSYASGHLEVSELAACLEKASFSCTSGHVKVF
ncbi:zinc finger, CCHC-type containing protein [Tanacetum coccineum]